MFTRSVLLLLHRVTMSEYCLNMPFKFTRTTDARTAWKDRVNQNVWLLLQAMHTMYRNEWGGELTFGSSWNSAPSFSIVTSTIKAEASPAIWKHNTQSVIFHKPLSKLSFSLYASYCEVTLTICAPMMHSFFLNVVFFLFASPDLERSSFFVRKQMDHTV